MASPRQLREQKDRQQLTEELGSKGDKPQQSGGLERSDIFYGKLLEDEESLARLSQSDHGLEFDSC